MPNMAAARPHLEGDDMLHSINSLIGHQLHALDGEFGSVHDFYFDDRCWAIRYLVADADASPAGRHVLLTPHAFASLDDAGKHMRLNLTRRQIGLSPPIDSDIPVSRQFELDTYAYYGLEGYWQGRSPRNDGAGTGRDASAVPTPSGQARSQDAADPHLRSVDAVTGYRLHASDGEHGHIADFLFEDQDWSLKQLVIKTGGWFSGSEVLIPTSEVERISVEDSTVFVSSNRETIRQRPEHLSVG